MKPLSPPSPLLPYNTIGLQCSKIFERIFQHIFQWDRGGVALRKSFGATHYCNARDPTICLSAHFWWCRLVESSSWLAIPPACSPGPLPLPPSAPQCCKLRSRRSFTDLFDFQSPPPSVCMCVRYIQLSYSTWIKRFSGIMELWWAILVLNC